LYTSLLRTGYLGSENPFAISLRIARGKMRRKLPSPGLFAAFSLAFPEERF
jgi:hypothetical protein